MEIYFFLQAEDGKRDLVRSRGLGDGYKRKVWRWRKAGILPPALVINGRNYSRKSVIDEALSRAIGQADGTPHSLAA